MVTVEELKAVVPDRLKKSVTQELADKVNQISTDPEACEVIRNTVVGSRDRAGDGRKDQRPKAGSIMRRRRRVSWVSRQSGPQKRRSCTGSPQDRHSPENGRTSVLRLESEDSEKFSTIS